MSTRSGVAGGLLAAFAACAGGPTEPSDAGGDEVRAELAPYAKARAEMVDRQLRGRDIVDERVLKAMATVPRHEFMPPDRAALAYEDGPAPIGYGVTISQPYIVALMTQLAEIDDGDRVLDVGTGSGYQSAVLAAMGAQVFGIEIIEPLAELADARLRRLGYDVDVMHGDGWKGRPEHAPYDAIIVAAAPSEIPAALREQLRVGGKLVLPVGLPYRPQGLTVVTRTPTGFHEQVVLPVAFVPLVREPPDA